MLANRSDACGVLGVNLEVLAAANAQDGKFADAISLQKRAIRGAQRFKWDTAPLQQRLAKYEARTAWTGNLLDP